MAFVYILKLETVKATGNQRLLHPKTCTQVKAGFREENMFVTTYVSKGRHTVKLKNQANGRVMGSGDFTLNGDCITQDFSIN
jgi:hypothetical protein